MDNLFKRLLRAVKAIFKSGTSDREEDDKDQETKEEKRKRGETEELVKNHVRILPNGDMLPLPYETSELHKIIDTVRGLAKGDAKRMLTYDTALSIALQPVRDIFDLYYLVPRIWHGDNTAINEFEKILQRGFEMHKPDINAFMMQSESSLNRLKSTTNIPQQDRNRPCEPIFFIKPDIIRTLHHAAYFLSDGERKSYQRNISTIDQMWRATSIMDSLNVATHMNERNKGETLDGMIHVIAKEHDLPDQTSGGGYNGRDPLDNGYGLTYPPIDEPWYPQDPGLGRPPLGPDGGPGYPGMPELPRDCFPFREYCEDVVRGITPNYDPMPDSIDIGGITGISPSHACAGDTVTISGSNFGNSQGENSVVFGTNKAEVISWSSTEIKVRVPAGLRGTYCVGIRDEDAENERRNIHNNNAQQFSGLNDSLRVCFGVPGRLSDVPYRPSSPECKTSNRIKIGKPIIAQFSVNESDSITVETGTELTLKWSVLNADSISIQRFSSTSGPEVNITNPHSGQQNIGAFNVDSVVTTKYRLTATNTCGTVSKIVEVTSTSSYSLGILGIEVTQAIQRFDWNSPGQNNSVRLVSRKRTMVRVYLESGMSNGFDFGAGANNLPNVTGHLKLTYPNGNTTIINNALNPGGNITVQSKQKIDRENLDHSLNFELPITNLHGNCTIEAEVNTNFNVNNQSVNGSTSVTFNNKNKITLRRMHVNDTINNNPAPTLTDFMDTLQGARKRVPVEEAGITVKTATGYLTLNTLDDEDLTERDDWSNLLSRIDDIADEFDTDGDIWVGLVPNDSDYAVNGIANDGTGTFGSGSGWFFNKHPRMLTKSGFRATFTHELGHTVGFGHAESVSEIVGPDVPSDVNEIDSTGGHGLNITVHQNTQFASTRIYVENDNTSLVCRLKNSSGAVIGSITYTDLNSGVRRLRLTNLPSVSPGNYLLELELTSGGGIGIKSSSFPYNADLISITGSSSDDNKYMYFFELQALPGNLAGTVSRCGTPSGVDDSLASLTEDVGVKLDGSQVTVIPKNIPTLMTYCRPILNSSHSYQNRWTSIDLWDRFWDEI